MKIAAISDTHGTPFTIPECDVFVHAGDMSAHGTLPEYLDFVRDVLAGRFRHGLIVPGNHDRFLAEHTQHWHEKQAFCLNILIDRTVEIEERVFYGSPWMLPFHNWHFMAEEDRLRELYRNMPTEVDVLITHGPAYGFCDEAGLGSKALAEAIAARKIGLHLFGHIHESGGESSGIHHNVSALDLQYQVRRGCTMFEI